MDWMRRAKPIIPVYFPHHTVAVCADGC
jgi:hypothetical protein